MMSKVGNKITKHNAKKKTKTVTKNQGGSSVQEENDYYLTSNE